MLLFRKSHVPTYVTNDQNDDKTASPCHFFAPSSYMQKEVAYNRLQDSIYLCIKIYQRQ